MQSLIDGFFQFRSQVFPRERQRFRALAHSQQPEALFITCADSRVVPNLITQTNPGELFICRSVGNQVPVYGSVEDGVSSTIEYAVKALNIKDIVICGHSDCGAMKALVDPGKLSNLPATAGWLKHASTVRTQVTEKYNELQESVLLPLVTEQNVITQLEHLKTHPSVAARLEKGDLTLHGWLYHIHAGDITTYDAKRARFVPLEKTSLAAQPEPQRLAIGGAA